MIFMLFFFSCLESFDDLQNGIYIVLAEVLGGVEEDALIGVGPQLFGNLGDVGVGVVAAGFRGGVW